MPVPWKEASGFILPAERVWLRDAAFVVSQRFKRPTIVNIGVWKCASMYCFRAGAPEACIVGIDRKPCPVEIHPELKAELILADSRTCHIDFKDPIHLLFVDGGHKYAVVTADIANWVPKVVAGGIVAFHDYAPSARELVNTPYLVDVKRAVDEWAALAGWKGIQAPDSLAAFRRLK